jgi:hypothetical protein
MMFKYTSKCQEIVKERSPLTAEGAAALARCVRRWRRIQTEFVGSFGELRWKEMQKALEDLASTAVRLKAR